VDLIKDPQSAVGKLPSEYLFPVFAYIPVEITAIRPRQATGEGRLADLPGPSDENIFRARSWRSWGARYRVVIAMMPAYGYFPLLSKILTVIFYSCGILP
jgi:hypothetical protein